MHPLSRISIVKHFTIFMKLYTVRRCHNDFNAFLSPPVTLSSFRITLTASSTSGGRPSASSTPSCRRSGPVPVRPRRCLPRPRRRRERRLRPRLLRGRERGLQGVRQVTSRMVQAVYDLERMLVAFDLECSHIACAWPCMCDHCDHLFV